jgi:serine/threonine-protein kinase
MSASRDALAEILETNRIRLVRKICDGGMGSVYEATLYGAMGFEKTVAIKTVLENLSANPEFVDMFIGEAKLVADLVHQNICQVYQLGKIDRGYYIAMEYVAGVDLARFIERHGELGIRVPPDLGTFIISRVCRGLEYAHSKRDRQGQLLGVVHRDVSPKNIMISVEGEVKLTDFGVAKARNLMKDQEGKVLLGKVQYMSPEQARLLPTDGRSDIFSLGIVLFELLTLEKLFVGGSTRDILHNVLNRPIPSLRASNPEVPAELEGIFHRAVARDLEQRYRTAGEMGYALEYAIYGKGYGPTILTLERYLRRLFPELYLPASEAPPRIAYAAPDSPTSIYGGD